MGEWNPYWEEVKGHVGYDDFWHAFVVQARPPNSPHVPLIGHDPLASSQLRLDMIPRYAWTVTDPPTVDFVAAHAGPLVIDPMAGTGYWARLLAERGATVLAYDRHAQSRADNHWHPDMPHWTRVLPGEASETVAAAGPDATLLLSWPPHATSDGADALRAYTGNRVVYIGEGGVGCTGDEELAKILDAEWNLAACHQPVQWWGIRDEVFIYQRAGTAHPAPSSQEHLSVGKGNPRVRNV